MLHTNLSVNEQGHLTVGGVDTVALANKYGTPLYILDEDKLRANCRVYADSMKRAFDGKAAALYASKALSFREMYRVVQEENLWVDVVSPGEIHTALSAGFAAENMFFHGNNKTDGDIRFALERGIGWFVVDNHDELAALDRLAGERGIRQKVLLRITPGIDPHTFEAVNTGKIDCQFGMPIETGQAASFVAAAMRLPHLDLRGYHCHIGSQIFDSVPFRDAADIMLDFAEYVRRTYGYVPAVLDLGGGFGVRYVESDPQIDIGARIGEVAAHIRCRCAELDLPVPFVLMEPGRSIVADACLTVYTVGSVKTINGYRSYVSVDGGMTDNPRYALYKSDYTVLLANRAAEAADGTYTVAGRCCETGALLQENVPLPAPRRGDRLAVLVTGAYNYAMASNYNRIGRLPTVMVRGGADRLAVRRETCEDLVACDL